MRDGTTGLDTPPKAAADPESKRDDAASPAVNQLKPTETRDAALHYRRRGIYPIFYARQKKAPQALGWQRKRLSLEEISASRSEGMNVGALLGEPSGGLVDVDLDVAEAIVIARRWLPPTGMRFGRAGKRSSHWLYRVASDLRRETYRDPDPSGDEKAMLVELRGTGHQTMFPPSIHPSGEIVEWEEFGEPSSVSLQELCRVVGRVAAATLLARHWKDGQRHDSTLPLAGFLLRRAWTEEETAEFLDAMAEAVGADRSKVGADVRDTARNLSEGKPVSGWPTLVQHFSERILEQAADWLELPQGPGGPVSPFGAAPAAVAWPDPCQLPPLTDPVPTLEPELIPNSLRDWLHDAADRLRIPSEFVALPAVSALASVVGRNLAIRPKSLDDWTLPLTLWGAVVGPPGAYKSPAVSEATRPLARLARTAWEAFQQESQMAEVDSTAQHARLKALKERMTAAAKKGNFSEFAMLKIELAALSGEPPLKPIARRYLTNDATVEKLGELLNENPRGLLLLRDELVGLLYSLEKQGRESDRAFYLESWNGTSSFYIDRIGRGSIHVPALTLSIFGGIQPDRLRGFFSGAMAEGGDMDGLLQRFQLIAWPDSLGEWRVVDRHPDQLAAQRAFRVFEKLDALNPADVGAQTATDYEIPYLRFAPEAQEIFYDFWERLMARVRPAEAERTPGFTAHLAKYSSLLPKLALLFHVAGVVDGGPVGPVGVEATKLAAAWVEFLEPHARKVYAAELKGNVAASHALADKIRAGALKDGMSVRDVYRREWSGLKTSGAVYEGLTVLDQVDWVRTEEVTGTTVIRLNPKLGGGK